MVKKNHNHRRKRKKMSQRASPATIKELIRVSAPLLFSYWIAFLGAYLVPVFVFPVLSSQLVTVVSSSVISIFVALAACFFFCPNEEQANALIDSMSPELLAPIHLILFGGLIGIFAGCSAPLVELVRAWVQDRTLSVSSYLAGCCGLLTAVIVSITFSERNRSKNENHDVMYNRKTDLVWYWGWAILFSLWWIHLNIRFWGLKDRGEDYRWTSISCFIFFTMALVGFAVSFRKRQEYKPS